MAIHIDATYENGVLRPSEPLNLPHRTPVHVTVVPQYELLGDEVAADEILPEGPAITVEGFRRIMSDCTLRAGTLPVDFDRDDIDSDHD